MNLCATSAFTWFFVAEIAAAVLLGPVRIRIAVGCPLHRQRRFAVFLAAPGLLRVLPPPPGTVQQHLPFFAFEPGHVDVVSQGLEQLRHHLATKALAETPHRRVVRQLHARYRCPGSVGTTAGPPPDTPPARPTARTVRAAPGILTSRSRRTAGDRPARVASRLRGSLQPLSWNISGQHDPVQHHQRITQRSSAVARFLIEQARRRCDIGATSAGDALTYDIRGVTQTAQWENDMSRYLLLLATGLVFQASCSAETPANEANG